MTSSPSLEAVEEGLTRHMPIRLHPCLDPFARMLPWLARRAACDPWHALSVFCPERCEAHTGAPARHAGMNATASQEAGLLRGSLPCAYPQALRERLIQPFRSAAVTNGAHTVVSVSADHRLASTMGFDHLLTPQVHGIMSRPMGQHRRDDPAWRGARCGRRPVALVEDSRLVPGVDVAAHGRRGVARASHGRVVAVSNAWGDVRLPHPCRWLVALDRDGSTRLPGAPSRTNALAVRFTWRVPCRVPCVCDDALCGTIRPGQDSPRSRPPVWAHVSLSTRVPRGLCCWSRR
jgi:hypothetical protein